MFGPHFDGAFPRNRQDMSFLTFIVYLTDDFEGGSTRFYPSGYEVKPVKGMACLFWHGSHRLSPGAFLPSAPVVSLLLPADQA